MRPTNLISKEQINLALKWLNDEISLPEIAEKMDVSIPNVYARLSIWIREAYKRGLIKAV
jgi:predicted DNA-binding protein YlxM (UPF0122 family)